MHSHVVLTVLKDCVVTRGMRSLDGLEHDPTPLYRLPPPPEEGYCQAWEGCKVFESKQAEELGADEKCIAHSGEGEKVIERGENFGDGHKVKLGLDEEGVSLREYIKRLPSYKEVIKKIVRLAANVYLSTDRFCLCM